MKNELNTILKIYITVELHIACSILVVLFIDYDIKGVKRHVLGCLI